MWNTTPIVPIGRQDLGTRKWFGFDCHHFTDYAPTTAAKRAAVVGARIFHDEHYWTASEARAEVALLAAQLAARKVPQT